MYAHTMQMQMQKHTHKHTEKNNLLPMLRDKVCSMGMV